MSASAQYSLYAWLLIVISSLPLKIGNIAVGNVAFVLLGI